LKSKKSMEKRSEWYEKHIEINGVVSRGKEVGKRWLTLGPWEWMVDYDKLLALSEGNHNLIEKVKSKLSESSMGFYKIKVYRGDRHLRLSDSDPDFIAVVIEDISSICYIAGAIGRDWSYDQSSNKHVVKIMSELL